MTNDKALTGTLLIIIIIIVIAHLLTADKKRVSYNLEKKPQSAKKEEKSYICTKV